MIDDLSGGTVSNVPSGVRLIERDVSDPRVVADIDDAAPDTVIHAAAQVDVTRSVLDSGHDRDVNLVGTELVLRGARAAGVSRFVFISSGGAVYGEILGATEEALPRPANAYGIHKLAAEGYVSTSGLSYGIVRFANVYGPRQRADLEGGVVAIFVERLRSRLPVTIYGSGDQSRDFVYVEDAVAATLAIALSDLSGRWNVGTGRATSVTSLLSILEQLTRTTAEITYAPRREGDVAISSLSPGLIAKQVGWKAAHSLEEGLRLTVAAEPRALKRPDCRSSGHGLGSMTQIREGTQIDPLASQVGRQGGVRQHIQLEIALFPVRSRRTPHDRC